MENYRLRYAPSPTGYLHIGNTRTALMDYLFAKHYQGEFILRIEDTDLERNVDDAISSQFSNLMWLGIIPDEAIVEANSPISQTKYDQLVAKYGEYQQSKKFSHYEQLAHDLVNDNKAYYCFCTPQELELDREVQIAQGNPAPIYNQKCRVLSSEQVQANLDAKKPYSIRFKVLQKKEYAIDDLVRGRVSFDSQNIGDFVILKTNKIATYNFAVVVDDHDMKISHVVRGEEHISNTPRQLMIYEAFGWDVPVFAHLTLIVDENHKKLSKRSGNALFFIEQYRTQGYLPQALFNYIALLGWSPKGEQEILSKAELIAQFDPQRFSKSPSTFDLKKLQWMNSVYMKKISEVEYLTFIKPFIDKNKFPWEEKDVDLVWLDAVLLLFKNEIEYGEQINNHLGLFFNQTKFRREDLAEIKTFGDFSQLIDILEDQLNSLDTWKVESIQELIKKVGIEAEKKGKDLFMPIRLFTTKSLHGPSLAQSLYLLGKAQVIENIRIVKEQNHD